MSAAVKNGTDSMVASGSRTAAVSRSAIVSCRMLFPRAPQPIPTDDRNRRGRRPPKGRPKAFLPPSWLTEGLEFVNHGFRRPTRGQSARPNPAKALWQPLGARRSATTFAIDASWRLRIKVAGLALRLSRGGINKNNIAGRGYGDGRIEGRCSEGPRRSSEDIAAGNARGRRRQHLDRQTHRLADPGRRGGLGGQCHRAQDFRYIVELLARVAMGAVQRRVSAVRALDAARQ